jgi:iron complex outermembrane receptor protein
MSMPVSTHRPPGTGRRRLLGFVLSATVVVLGLAVLPARGRASPVYAGSVRKKAKAKEEQKIRKKKHAPFTESTIGKQTIRQAPPSVNIVNILSRTPSINAYSEGPNGMRSYIQLRGFSGYQISVTFDGIPLNDLFNAGAFNYASTRNSIPLSLGDISGVSVYRGINNPSVNSLNSLGGTINYEPRQPSPNFGGQVTLGGGTFDTLRYGALVNTGTLGGFRTLVSFTHDHSHGWVHYTHDTNNNFYLATSKRYNQGLSKFYAYLIVNENEGATPHTVPVPLIEKYGRSYQWPLSWTTSEQADHHILALIGLDNAISSNAEFVTKMYYISNTYNRTSYTNPAEIPELNPNQPYYLPNQPESYATYNPPDNYYNPVALFGSSYAGTAYHLYIYNTSTLGVQPSVRVSLPHNDLIVGLDGIYGVLHSAEFWYGNADVPQDVLYNDAWNERDQRSYLDAFAQDTVSFFGKRLQITPGIKYTEINTTDADNTGYFYAFGGTASNKLHDTSPSLGVSYQVIKPLVVYASWGRTFKAPEIGAYYNDIGNTNVQGQDIIPPVRVQPEYVRDLEAGVRYFTPSIEASLALYREDFRNKFQSYSPISGPFSGISLNFNGGTARYQGIELSLRKYWFHWYAFTNYSVNEAYYGAFVNPYTKQLEPADAIPDVPHHMLNVGVGWRGGPWTADVYLKYTGPRYAGLASYAGISSNYKIAGYTTTNLNVSYRPLRAFGLSLSVYNLFNKDYYAYAFENTAYHNRVPPFIQALVGEPRAVYVQGRFYF